MVIIELIVVVVVLILLGIAAEKMQAIAEQKGSNERYWAWCFWLPVIGYAMVIALPNSKQTRYQEEIVQLLRENNELLKKEHTKPIEKQQQLEEKQPIQTPVPKAPTTTVSEYEIMRRKRKAEEEAKRTLASHNLIECPSCGTVQRRDRDVCIECGMSLK